jgi:hypothetical protein
MCARSGLRHVCPFRTTECVPVQDYGMCARSGLDLWHFITTPWTRLYGDSGRRVWKDGLDRSGARSLLSVQRIELLRMTSYARCVKQPV